VVEESMSNKMFKVDDKRAEAILKDLDDWWPGDGWDKTIRDLLADRALVAPLVQAAIRYGDAVRRDGPICQGIAKSELLTQARIIADAANAGKGARE
jgi:hypothetical protein